MKSIHNIVKSLVLLSCCLFGYTSIQAQADLCAGATPLPVSSGSCSIATFDLNALNTNSGELPAPPCGAHNGGPDVWFSVTVPASGNLTVTSNTTGGISDGVMTIYSGTCGSLAIVECDDDDGPGLFPEIKLTGRTPGEVLLIRYYEFGGNALGTFGLCAFDPPPPPANDHCSGAFFTGVASTQASCVPIAVNTTQATPSVGVPTGCTSTSQEDDVWYFFVAPSTQVQIQFDNIVGTTSVGSALYVGSCAGANVGCNLNSTGQNPDLSSKFTTIPGQIYYLRVWLPGSTTSGTFDMCVFLPPPPPVNDNCSGALSVPLVIVAPNEAACGGTIVNIDSRSATNSGSSQSGCITTSQNDDVWFGFIATSTTVRAQFTNFNAGTTLAGVAVYNGCTGSSIFCDITTAGTPTESDPITGLAIGQLYYMRVWTSGSTTEGTWDMCLYTPPGPPSNDDCAGADFLSVQPVGGCNAAVATPFSLEHATHDGAFTCDASANYGVWYEFIATAPSIDLRLNTFTEYALFTACGGTQLFCASGSATTIPRLSGLSVGSLYKLVLWTDTQFSATARTVCLEQVPPPPVNDDCGGAIPISLAPNQGACSPVFVDTRAASRSTPNPSCTSTSNNDDVWYVFVATSPALQVQFENIVGATSVGTALHTSCGTSSIACDFASDGTTTDLSEIFCGLNVGDTYYLRVWLNGTTSEGTFDMCAFVPATATNDNVCDAINVGFGTTAFSNVCASAQPGEPGGGPGSNSCNSQDGWCSFEIDVDNSVWFTFQAPASGCVTIVADGPGFDAQLTLFEVGNCNDFNSFRKIAANDDSGDDVIPGAYVFSAGIIEAGCLNAGQTYYIQVDGYNGDLSADAVLYLIDCGGELPSVSAGDCQSRFLGYAPAEAEINWLNAAASGSEGPFTYSWSPSTGIVSAACDFSTIGVQPGSTTTYTVTITDSRGCQASSSVTVNVYDVTSGCSNNNNVKVQVCHVPPGNPGNAHNICISSHAVPAHLVGGSGHGTCYLGPCGNPCLSKGTPADPIPFCSAQFIDDFENGIGSLWSSVTNATVDNLCGTANGAGALRFNGPTTVPRAATTVQLPLGAGSAVQFSLKIGTGTSASGCENADANEDVQLQYSTNGVTFTTIAIYDSEDFNNFTTITEVIPSGAICGSGVYLRWIQPQHSGNNFDNWAIDDVSIVCQSSKSAQQAGSAFMDGLEVKAFPNPFGNLTTISFSSVLDESIRLDVYSITGQHISTLFDGKVEGGQMNDVEFKGIDLPDGVYIYRLISQSGKVANGKLYLAK